MNVWAVANQKGGVGKTTTAVTIAGHLAKRGKSVLLVDMDPHGSMTTYFGHDPDNLEQSLYTLFQNAASVREVIIPTGFENLSLIPGSTALATLDRQLGTQEGKGLVLKKALQSLQDRYEYVILDCPPLLGILMVNALAACEHLLLPVQTEFLAMKGLERMLRTISMILTARKNSFAYTIVPTMFDRRTRASLEALRTMREQFGEELWDSVIPVDTQFREASRVGKPLSIMAPSSRGSRAYEALLDRLLGQAENNIRHLQLVTS